MKALEQRAIGSLAGAAVGDALGGATEGRSPEQIKQRYGGYVTGIVGPFLPDWQTARPMSPYHKGDGHITDDTLMTNTIVKVYEAKRDHLDAYDMADLLVPLLMNEKVWIPELEKETVALNRIFLAEKWLVTRLHYGHVDPREAGNGNVVNCGAAMYMAPVGIANATNPQGAYAEAIEIAGAHQLSYGREAAGVFAAAVAEAMRPGASVDDVIQASLSVARDGTRSAIEAVAKAATTVDDWQSAIGVLREAIVPFDTVGPNYREPGLGARRPSRLHAIEELPVALGMVIVARGNYTDAVLGAINYGRDSDSIATMAGAICGAMHGIEAIPEEWRNTVARNSRLDLTATGRSMAGIAVEIRAKDRARHAASEAAFAEFEVAGA
ncbi:ADP-ribosylglycohydrolase [Micromonospora rhizosphaerae]|uniref:ADP-ribosylglycohydrolase n=1 Tax=Micromonospora rhizosphaerae TaxID=568872 RepID=A0A1C6SN18_9ACTN|nr:ADP-ribosylglycohydrolase family protein [Micromonospora rhizosphaerae]SCL30838.1 ADP-ribosylglycohydrolase [Micromonospora rhizosphaerae]